jgi:hypothetical protein
MPTRTFRLFAIISRGMGAPGALAFDMKGTVLLGWMQSRKAIPYRIVKRREELLEEIKAVFPDPTNHLREALTSNIDVIATHDEWSKQLQNFLLNFPALIFLIPEALIHRTRRHFHVT